MATIDEILNQKCVFVNSVLVLGCAGVICIWGGLLVALLGDLFEDLVLEVELLGDESWGADVLLVEMGEYH